MHAKFYFVHFTEIHLNCNGYLPVLYYMSLSLLKFTITISPSSFVEIMEKNLQVIFLFLFSHQNHDLLNGQSEICSILEKQNYRSTTASQGTKT